MSSPPVTPLIRTKLAPPRLGSLRVGRESLLDMLERRRNRSLTLVVGPAGSGKTTLMALWRKRLIAGGASVAWYNAGADDDEGQWCAYWFASLQQAGVDVGPALTQALQQDVVESDERFVALVANALFMHAKPVVLILEDLHVLAGRRALAQIQRLLSVLPDNLHLVLTARVPPALDLSELRLKDQLTEVNFDQLRLSLEEQVQFLGELGANFLTPGQHKRLYAVTEGWVIGAQLSGLILKKVGDFDAALTRYSSITPTAEGRGLWNSLEASLGTLFDPTQIDVLVRMSACRRFNKDLCCEVCGDPGAGDVLAAAAAQNLFVLPIESDDTVQWYRYHRVFSALLQRRLERLPAAEQQNIHRRACAWFERRGLTTEAVRHAHHAGDTGRMGDLIAAAARPLRYAAQFLQLLRWTSLLPLELWRERLDVLVTIAWCQTGARHLGDAELTLRMIDANSDATRPDAAFELSLMRALQAVLRDDCALAMRLLPPAEQAPEHDAFLQLLFGTVSGMALVGLGDYERARDLVADCQASLRKRYGARSRPYLDSIPGNSFLVQGDFVQARDVLDRVLRELEHEDQLAEYSTAHIAGYLAEACYQLDDLDAAEDHLDVFAESVDSFGMPDCALYALWTKARLYDRRGDTQRALAELDAMERLAQTEGWDRMAAWSLAERVFVLGRRSESLTAMREAMRRLRRMAARQSHATQGSLVEIGIAAAIAEVDAATAELEWQRAAGLAQALADDLRTKGRIFLAARLRVKAAIALHESGNPEQALLLARGALLTAQHCGMRRLFAEEGARGLRLAEALRGLSDLRTEEQRLLDGTLRGVAAQLAAAPPAAPPAPATVVVASPRGANPLSPKEHEILQLLARALSTKTIARALNVSPGTVKWHLKNVYGKLQAVSREDAMGKARAMGILA